MEKTQLFILPCATIQSKVNNKTLDITPENMYNGYYIHISCRMSNNHVYYLYTIIENFFRHLDQEVSMSSKLVASKGDAGNSTELKVEQLRRENAELHAALEARTQENILLNEVISTVGSTLKLDEVLGHLVDTIVRAISCHAVF